MRHTWRTRLWTVALALGLAAVARVSGSTQATPLSTERSSRDWKRLTSDELTAIGNASEGELRRALTALEDFRFALRSFPKPDAHLGSSNHSRRVHG